MSNPDQDFLQINYCFACKGACYEEKVAPLEGAFEKSFYFSWVRMVNSTPRTSKIAPSGMSNVANPGVD